MQIFQVFFNVWNALSGNKTKIAAVLGFATTFIIGVEGQFPSHPAFLDSVTSVLTQITLWLGGVGLVHQAVKAADKSKPPAQVVGSPVAAS